MSPRRRAPKPSQHDRSDRRAAVDVLLARLQRGVISPAEGALLAEYVRAEQANADETRASLTGTTRALARAREAADDAVRELEADRDEWRQRAQNREAAHRRASDRATKAEGTIERVRGAERIGDALAAVAEYDGLTPAAAQAHAAFADAADSARARLDEQARDHAIALAVVEKRAETASRIGTRYLARAEQLVAAVRKFADGLATEPHPSHDHVCPDDVREDLLAVVAHVNGEQPGADQPIPYHLAR